MSAGSEMVEQLYHGLVQDLMGKRRPFLNLTPEARALLLEEMNQLLEPSPNQTFSLVNYERFLCILNHLLREDPAFFPFIIFGLESPLIYQSKDPAAPNLVVLVLACFRKQIMGYHQKMGIKIPREMVEKLKIGFEFKKGEVEEWTLRTLDELGAQALPLYPVILKNKPGVLALLRPAKNRLLPLYQQLLGKLESFPQFSSLR